MSARLPPKGSTVSNERLWAPWRLEYVLDVSKQPEHDGAPLEFLPDADEDCFICQAVADSNDRQRLVVGRGKHTLTILNRYPYNNGHLLIAPRRHVARLDELNAAEQTELSDTMAGMVTTLEKILSAQGFNIGLNLGRAAGAGLPGHLHWHIVPRWVGDCNFMPSLAGIKVIPQSLDALWEALAGEK
jgi:ATP adenylyltransferase